ncbi:MAG: response regulator [Candidatus Methylomirabilales bacterium]
MPKAKILVVDDQPLIRTMLSDLLTEAGCQVVTAADGEEGLALLKQEAPALVILDKVMPRMGWGGPASSWSPGRRASRARPH